MIDFTDTANPVEIAFFDRGPIRFGTATGLNLGGFWATYYYNGNIFGTEIARGFDTFQLEASDMLSQNEIDAASEIVLAEFNWQLQSELVAAPSFNVAGSYFDQAVRGGDLTGKQADKVGGSLAKAEKLEGKGETAPRSSSSTTPSSSSPAIKTWQTSRRRSSPCGTPWPEKRGR